MGAVAPDSSIAYLNGHFLPLAEATVPVLDRGFLFGDGVYEVIPVYGGRPFRISHHMQRLEQSLAAVRMASPHSVAEWQQLIFELVERNGGGDLSIYLQVTRGVEPREHHFPDNTPATVLLSCSPLTGTPPQQLEQGIAAITEEDGRWSRCDIKSINLLANVLHRQHALDRGAKEAILIRDGWVTEGAASNLFALLSGEVVTPPKGPHLLPGVTRDLVLELAREAGISTSERGIGIEELKQADELWITSSTREIVPITRLDEMAVGSGGPGAVTMRLHQELQRFKRSFAEQTV